MQPDAVAAIANADLPMGDDAIRKGSGRSWREWVELLDSLDGTAKTHTELARLAHEHGAPDWWAQSTALGYERIRGMRQRYQDAAGFRTSASKTIAVSVDRLYEAWADETIRDQWIEPGSLRWRTGKPGKSARLDLVAAGTILAVNFIDKGTAKSAVAVEQGKLAAAEDIEPAKAFWKEHLSRLADIVTAADEPG